MSTPPFELRGGTIALGKVPVLSGIDLTINDGEFLVILGSNGSGKTTLVRALLGLIPLTQGELTLFGTPLRRFREWSRVGYVPQRFSATAGVPASVEEVVLSGRVSVARRFRGYGKDDRAAAGAALEAVQLAGRIHDPVDQLSMGQQQRVLIARALAGRPDVLVLDEPLAGVDQERQGNFALTLSELNRSGRTVVLVAHELGALQSLVSRAVLLGDGRIGYDGPPLDEHFHIEHLHHHPGIEAALPNLPSNPPPGAR